MLGAEVLRTPEPVGIPAPQVAEGAEIVLLALADREVVDVVEGVVAGRPRLVAEAADADDLLARTEHDAVDEIRRRIALRRQIREEAARVRVVPVLDMHAALDRDRAQPHPQRITERAVGIGETEEQVAVFVVWRAGNDFAGGQQHVELEHRVVHQAVPERCGLDADAGHRPADGDGLQLRHHRRHHPQRQRRCHERLVGRQPLDVDPALARAHFDDMAEVAQVQALLGWLGPVAKQVRTALVQAQRACSAGSGTPARQQAIAPRGVGVHVTRRTDGPGSSGGSRASRCPC